jgi:hypothetical protein
VRWEAALRLANLSRDSRVLLIRVHEPVRIGDARAGHEALRSAFEAHYAAFARLCLMLAHHPQDAEDMAQEAFVRLEPKIEIVTSWPPG